MKTAWMKTLYTNIFVSEIQENKFTKLSFDGLLRRRLKMDSSDKDTILITLSKKKKTLGTQNKARGVSPPHREAETIPEAVGEIFEDVYGTVRAIICISFDCNNGFVLHTTVVMLETFF